MPLRLTRAMRVFIYRLHTACEKYCIQPLLAVAFRNEVFYLVLRELEV